MRKESDGPAVGESGVGRVALAPLPRARRRWLRGDRALALLVLSPSIVAVAVFIYSFIVWSFYISTVKWNSSVTDYTFVGLDNWVRIFTDDRFQTDLRNLVLYAAGFMTQCIVLGFTLAVLLDQKIRGESVFRTIFIFPFAVSGIVTGVVWRWIFTPSTGVNLILDKLGVAHPPGWITDPKVVGDVSGALDKVIPGGDFIQVKLGIPLAIIPVVIAAAWQLGGFAMANFLAALGAIPPELREAASLDGATWWQYQRRVVLPLLWPMIVAVGILLAHVSLKSFDLVYAMVGQGPGFATDVPGIFVFEQTFRALRWNTGAAASVVMLLLVSLVVMPYVYRRTVKEAR
jgi:glucose/mannose transport system permease protein